jgi:glycosyltransferase involved in cell wall biosynthesis
MITISLCMIVKNEEDVIARCLDCVKDIADEIIIVDTGSTDTTKEICKQFTDKIYDFEWIDDFSAARNFSYSKATMEYIMWLDADDIILEQDIIKLMDLKQTLSPIVDAVMMKYNYGFDANGNITLSFYRERLTKGINNFKWHEPVHEHLDKNGIIINLDICITHRKLHATSSDRNLTIYERALSNGGTLTPRGQYYYSRELYNHGRYKDAIDSFNKFLNSGAGWVEDNIVACQLIADCYNNIND